MVKLNNSLEDKNELWNQHSGEWRDPLEILSLNDNVTKINKTILKSIIEGRWWEIIEELGITLFVTREYEHLIMALCVLDGKPRISYLPLPHPSGMVFDKTKKILHVASTRNPNQIFKFGPMASSLPRLDIQHNSIDIFQKEKPLLPVSSIFLPGSYYLHDLAMIDNDLYANAVGHNAIIRLDSSGSYKRVWWPKCIEDSGKPNFGQNYLQLNSIASGQTLEESFFSASTDKISFRRPGHSNFKVDKQGVIYSGMTREPIARGLTRPHSARLHHGTIWVANSGYGEVGTIKGDVYETFYKFDGWTRGLCFHDSFAFVGTSRVIPRFSQYAPGLNVEKSISGIHILNLNDGKLVGSIIWPYGNQVFSIEAIKSEITCGFSTRIGVKRALRQEKALYYSYIT